MPRAASRGLGPPWDLLSERGSPKETNRGSQNRQAGSMTQKDGSPEASEGPYWSEELLAVLVVGLGDETQARETLEGIIQQALSGRTPAAPCSR